MSKPKAALHTVAGVAGTRTSPRVYTHATVVTYDPVWYAKHKEADRVAHRASRAKAHWDFVLNFLTNNDTMRARAVANDAAFAAKCLARNPERAAEIAAWEGIETSSHDDYLKRAQDMLIRWGNRDAYVAAEIVHEKQLIAKEYALGVYRYVLSWHMSPTAAAAFANTQARSGQYPEVTVEEVTRA